MHGLMFDSMFKDGVGDDAIVPKCSKEGRTAES